MTTFTLNHFSVTPDKQGAREYAKVSYPIRYGRYHEIATPNYIFEYNLNGEIKFIRGRAADWPHSAEWLKRTVLNDWVYYSTCGYTGAFGFLGEYYLPNLSYASNSILGGAPFEQSPVQKALAAWQALPEVIRQRPGSKMPAEVETLLKNITANDARALRRKALRHMALLGGRVSVLPPDSRHVDYDLIPLVVADGCLHNCGFCRVKSRVDFVARTPDDVLRQIEDLKSFYACDLSNYHALFLGMHDALYADPALILFAADRAYDGFGFDRSGWRSRPRLFLFGSALSLLQAGEDLFADLDRRPYLTSVNIGLESADPATLAHIRKPTPAGDVVAAFDKMVRINRTYANIEITANFILSDDLPPGHTVSLLKLIREKFDRPYSKGAIYLSPFEVQHRNPVLQRFSELKRLSRLPLYLYLIQRL